MMVVLAQKGYTAEVERRTFVQLAADARRYWRELNPAERSGKPRVASNGLGSRVLRPSPQTRDACPVLAVRLLENIVTLSLATVAVTTPP